ncbi:hypothetical protein [Gemella haemolysans]|uniref:Uncharacterized protein n=2 Tax=Gemella haemolysans TaxID=1379 RepID=A0AA87B609_9BACL|nr:hypothetical protein [Gemella haemolysans]EGF86028.1 hypothetical protein HMPREF0428_01830 [Gemella haemolysans M341]QIX87294.1 hypothetical protein FOC48_00265 [Gemella haemolysans]DAU15916.1 MAG TPA: hypothetical protein [Caudoviricetes sp.]
MTNEELQQEVERLEEQLAELRIKILESKTEEKPYKVELPDDIGDYYTLDVYGAIYYLEDFSMNFVRCRYERGLVFETRKEAEKYDKERMLLFKLHKWAEERNGGWTPDWKDDEIKYYITDEYDRFIIDYTVCYRMFTKLPYFKSEEIAEQFIEEFGDEIKEVFC